MTGTELSQKEAHLSEQPGILWTSFLSNPHLKKQIEHVRNTGDIFVTKPFFYNGF